jgi:replicative DNA helicase
MNSLTEADIKRLNSAKRIEAEFLGTLIRYPAELTDARDLVSVGSLHHDAHQRIYSALLRLHARKDMIDLAGVFEELRRSNELDDIGGAATLGELLESSIAPSKMPQHIDRVLSMALHRDMQCACVESLRDCIEPSGPPAEMLELIQSRFSKLAERISGTDATPFVETVNRLMEELDARSKKEKHAGLMTGFSQLDEILCGGLAIGGLTILAARPSVGKTSFAGHIARNVSERGGAVLFCSLEQQQLELAERVIAGDARVSGKRLRTGELEPQHWNRISESADRTRSWRLWINDHSGQSSGQIASGARRTKRKAKGLDLIIVDYLNIIRHENPKWNRTEQVGASCLRLRDMGRELNVPVLLLCQLNRQAANEAGPPKLHHLKESGDIEQDADAVLFLHRAAAWEPNRPDQIELHVAKQRNGPLGVIPMDHESRIYTFSEKVPT